MAIFESDIQELLYGILTGDTTLSAYLGGDELNKRISLSFNNSEVEKISSVKPAYIIIETMPVPAPVVLSSGIEERMERYCLHIFTKPEKRGLRAAIGDRLRELLHRKTFRTNQLIIYNVSEDGREGTITGTDLFDYRYTIAFHFVPKGDKEL